MSATHWIGAPGSVSGFGAAKAPSPLPDLNDSSIATLQGEMWIFWIFTCHWTKHISGDWLQQLQVFVLSERIISFTENQSLLSTPVLNCESSPSLVLLKGSEETPGSVQQLGFPPSWQAPAPGNAQQAGKQLRHSSIQLALRATLDPHGTDSACPCVLQNHCTPLDKQRFKGIT